MKRAWKFFGVGFFGLLSLGSSMAQPIESRANTALTTIEEAVDRLRYEYDVRKLSQRIKHLEDGAVLVEVTYSIVDIRSPLADNYRYTMLLLKNGENQLNVEKVSHRD
jgi:hypothetical protein